MEPLASRQRIKLITDADKRAKVIAALSASLFDDAKLKEMIKTFEAQIKLANSTVEDKRKQTDLYWENTFVRRLFDGTENGTYLGIDLGGTNFRIVRVDLKDGEATTEKQYYDLKDDMLVGPCAVVFDYIASCLNTFVSERQFESTKKIPLGFTFSFPSIQASLRKSILQTWTKRMRCTDGPGLDPVVLLEEAIKRNGALPVQVVVVARISDTTGTFLAGNLVDKKCRIGLIVGTGSNAAFVEYTKNIEKWDKCYKDDDPSDLVVINCEFGCFGDNGCMNFMKTDCDFEVDKHSPHPGSFTFEKFFSGLYLGELVRINLVNLIDKELLFQGCNTEKLRTRWQFPTAHVTEIEKDVTDSTNTKKILQEYGLLESATEDDVLLVRDVSDFMSQRAAYIIATAMVVLLDHIDLPEVTIAIDGSLYEHHPNYHKHMQDLISKWRPATKTKMILVKDGSGQGGALVAAIDEKRAKATNS